MKFVLCVALGLDDADVPAFWLLRYFVSSRMCVFVLGELLHYMSSWEGVVCIYVYVRRTFMFDIRSRLLDQIGWGLDFSWDP